MLAKTPDIVTDVAAWAGAALTLIALASAIGAMFVRTMRRVIREEVPQAVGESFPDVTRAMIREEVEHVTEPMFAGLRAELKPNGGSSFSDLVNKRLTAQDEKLQELADQLTEVSGAAQEGE